jgi:hypothetical protein
MTKKLFWIGGFVGAVMFASIALLAWMNHMIAEAHERNAPNRAALLAIHTNVVVGASEAEAKSLIERFSTPQLNLGSDSEHIRVWMPFEVGAGDWCLQIRLSSGFVSAIQMRTSDGPAPADGPPDKP